MSESERVPLLNEIGNSTLLQSQSTSSIYDRFTKKQKGIIVSVISLAGFIGPFASGCFVPCIPEVASDLNTTAEIINYTVGAYIFTIGIGNLIWAPYVSFYGRQPLYLFSIPLICLGSFAAAAAQTVAQLAIGRTILGLGCACVLVIGPATISDIYALEERGSAMGIYLGIVFLAPPLAPILGGFLATYASWRIVQLFLGFLGLVTLICTIMFLPETSHPGTLGIDKLVTEDMESSHRLPLVFLNPLKVLTLLRGPIVLFVAAASAIALLTDYVLVIPITYTLSTYYGITSPALIGACLLPSGIGNILGAVFSGRFADMAVIRGRKRRQGRWVPEDRLLATIPGALFLIPVSQLLFGLTAQFIPGRTGLVIVVVCISMNGLGNDMVLGPCATYFVDIFSTKGPEALAVSSAFRNTFSAIATASALPLILSIGIVPTYCLSAIIAWCAFLLIVITIRYGHKLRAMVDLGYTKSIPI